MNVDPTNRGALFGLQGMVGSIAWAVAPAIAGPMILGRPVEVVLYVIPIALMIGVVISRQMKKSEIPIAFS